MHFAPKMHFDPIIGFLSHKIKISRKKNVGTFLGKSKGRVKKIVEFSTKRLTPPPPLVEKKLKKKTNKTWSSVSNSSFK